MKIQVPIEVKVDEKGRPIAVVTKDILAAAQAAQVAQQKLSGVSAFMKTFGSGLGIGAGFSAATASANLLIGAVRSIPAEFQRVVEAGGQIADLSDRTGVAVVALQELQFAGSLVGVSLEQAASGVTMMQKALVGSPEKFAALGLSAQELIGMNPDEAFNEIAEAIAAIPNPTEQAAAAMDALGKSGATLLPLIKSMQGARAEAALLGAALSEEQIGRLDAMGDAQTRLTAATDGLKGRVAALVVEVLNLDRSMDGIAVTLGGVNAEADDTSDGFALAARDVNGFIVSTLKLATGLAFIEDALARQADRLYQVANAAKAAGQAYSSRIFKPDLRLPGPQGQGALDLLTEGVRDDLADLKKANDEIERLRASLLGSDKAIADLARGWASLTPEQQANEAILANLSEAYDKLRTEHLGPLPADLETARDKFRELTAAAQSWAIVAGDMPSLTGGGGFIVPDLPEPPKVEDRSGAPFFDAYQEYFNSLLKEQDEQRDLAAFRARAAKDLAAMGKSQAQINAILGITVDLTKGWRGALMGVSDALFDASRLLSGIGDFLEKANIGSERLQQTVRGLADVAQNAAASAAAFASGDIVGGIAAGLSAAGGLVGVIKGLFTSDVEKAARAAAHRLGVAISDELAQAILDTAEEHGISTSLASLLHITDAIEESGADPREFANQIADLMNAIVLGAVPAAEGIEQLGSAFNQVAEAAIKAGTVGDRQLVGLIRRARELGLAIPEIDEFVRGALADAAEGVGLFAGNLKIVTPEDAAAQATIFSATFWAMVEEQGLIAAADALGPAFEKIMDQLRELDIDPGPLFGGVLGQMALAQNEAFRAASQAVQGLTQALTGLANSGYLTADAFNAFGQQAQSAYDQALQAAIESGQGQEQAQTSALAAIMPLLIALRSASEQYGFALDANTQRLIDQAEAAGFAFPVDPIIQVRDAIYELIEAITGIPREVNIRVNTEHTTTGDDGTATGGGPVPPPFEDGSDRRDRVSAASGLSGAGGPLSPRFLPNDTLIQAHAGEHALIIPKGHPVDVVSAAGGFGKAGGRDRGGERPGPGGGGGGGFPGPAPVPVPVPAPGSSSSAAAAAANDTRRSVDRLARTVEDLAKRPASTIVGPTVQIQVDPLGIKEREDQLLREVESSVAAGIRTGNSPILRELKRGGYV